MKKKNEEEIIIDLSNLVYGINRFNEILAEVLTGSIAAAVILWAFIFN